MDVTDSADVKERAANLVAAIIWRCTLDCDVGKSRLRVELGRLSQF